MVKQDPKLLIDGLKRSLRYYRSERYWAERQIIAYKARADMSADAIASQVQACEDAIIGHDAELRKIGTELRALGVNPESVE